MKRPFTILAVASSLAIGVSQAQAGDLQFNTPATERAERSSELLTRAAYAINDRVPRISDLWVFPTNETNTVFARYTVAFAGDGVSNASSEHLALVTLGGDGIVKLHELAAAPRSPQHWSASIGNGHTSESSVVSVARNESGGRPSAPHWSARIGSGRATSAEGASAPASTTSVAQAARTAPVHWTALIGTGSGVDGK